jgi:hypothetical protein
MFVLPEYDEESASIDSAVNYDDSDSGEDSVRTMTIYLSHLTVGSTSQECEETDDGSQFGTCVLFSDDMSYP